MAVYLYAVCEAGVTPPSIDDPQAPSLRVVSAEGLAALVRDREAAPSFTAEDDLWEHERVVEELMSSHELLPVRFGSLLDDDAAVRDLLRCRGAELRSRLQAVAGSAELGVRAVWDERASAPQPPAEGRGRGAAYLAGLLDLHRRARELGARLENALGAIAKDSRIRLLRSANMPFSGAYLVSKEGIEEFRVRVLELNDAIEDAQIVCTGPWPPYSFSEARGGDG